MIKKSLFIINIIGILLFTNHNASSQCFASPGNPVAGNANLGVLDKGIIRTIAFYQYTYADRYYEGSNSIIWDAGSALSSANFNYTGLSIGYGISNKFTIETELGYFINKTQYFKNSDISPRDGRGLSNAVISGKYNIYKNVINGIEFSMAAGAKVPFSTKPQTNEHGTPLHIDVQPSIGSFGAVFQSFFVKEFDNISARLMLINRYETNFTENDMGYRFGDSFITSLFLSKHLANQYTHLTKDLTAIVQLRHEYIKPYYRYGDLRDQVSGNNSFYIAPQLNYNLNMLWNFSLIYDLPVYQYYNGIQLADTYRITFTVTRDFGF